MKLPDTNVLIYSVNTTSRYHDASCQWLQQSLGSAHGVGMAWIVLIGFLRLTTHPRILPTPLPIATALGLVDEWLSHPNVHIVDPGERHAGILGRILLTLGTAGNLTNDAHLAALAIEHNAEVATFDRDFHRFEGARYQILG